MKDVKNMNDYDVRNFYDFCKIIEKLRSPGGCPWDREQTHKSLSKHLIEEAYEAYDAIEENSKEHIMEELGDVLLQIVMHAQIGKEEGEFDIGDVIDSVGQKMIDRHPHVFGNTQVKSSSEVLDNWEEIKKQQRGQKTVTESINSLSRSLPALYKTQKVIDKVKRAKIDCINPSQKAVTQEQIGQKLFEICVLAYENKVDAEMALSSYTKKFIKKIKNIEENT